jgi:hypothetical protein
MPLSRRKFATLVLAALPPRVWAQAPVSAGRRLDFRIADGFNAGEDDIRAVLLSAAETIWKHCPDTRWEVPGFHIYYNDKHPIAGFDHRADGRVSIGLNVQGNHWAQFAYQFAHEFCHALAGHSNDWKKPWIRETKANHWLEESLCETASLFALRAMGEVWKSSPPFPNWKSYAGSLTQYAAERLANTAASLPAGVRFGDWFRENEAALRANSTLREKNNIVAMKLLPVFEKQPAGWESIACFNLAKGDPAKSLVAHFAQWSGVAPPGQREFIAKVATVFGIGIP